MGFDLDGFVRDRMADHGVPGLSLAVIDGGEVAHTAGYGVASAGAADLVTSRTLFQACSISKPVVALAVLRLVERGRLDLDADVGDLLTSWRVPPTGEWQPRITLRQLLSHTAGLTTGGFPGHYRDQELPTPVDVLLGRAPANTAGVRVDIVPGTRFRYSGGGTTVVHQLLEDVTGTPLPDLMRELVLDPLGLSESTYVQPLPAELHPRAASGHRRDGSRMPGEWLVYPEAAAAGLWTTPADLCRYSIGIQRAVAGAPDALVSPEMAREMLTPVAATGRWNLDQIGLGLFLGGAGRDLRFGHAGSNQGFQCQLVGYAEAGQGAVVMTNSDGGRVLCFEVLAALADARGWATWPPLGEDWERVTAERLERETGRYAVRPGMSLDVVVDGSDLQAGFTGQAPMRFLLDEGRRYYSASVDAVLTFTGDGAGTVASLEQDGETLLCPRSDVLPAPAA